MSAPTIKRLEAQDGLIGGRDDTGARIVRTIEAAGVEFSNGGQPGVRLTKAKPGPIAIEDLNASNDE